MSMHNSYCQISSPYLLLTFIPFYRDVNGNVWLDKLWCQDFIGHTKYLQDLTLLAPEIPFSHAVPDLEPVSTHSTGSVRFVSLKPQTSMLRALLSLPHSVRTLWMEIRRADIVHSGIAGWPFPLGWIANPIALVQKKKLVLVIESAPWRTHRSGLINMVRSPLTEWLGRYFVKRADLTIATQPSYLESFGSNSGRGTGFVNPATWIHEEDIPSYEVIIDSWNNKMSTKKTRFLFAGRLEEAKGVTLLLSVLDFLESEKIAVEIDVIGLGNLKEKCELAANQKREFVEFRLLEPVPYGSRFFELIRGYHCVLVPSLGDEQPRVIFDAYSQGVPVMASNTDGIRPHVEKSTGWLVNKGDAPAWTNAVVEATENFEEFRSRGLEGYRYAKHSTHDEMHRKRSFVLNDLVTSRHS